MKQLALAILLFTPVATHGQNVTSHCANLARKKLGFTNNVKRVVISIYNEAQKENNSWNCIPSTLSQTRDIYFDKSGKLTAVIITDSINSTKPVSKRTTYQYTAKGYNVLTLEGNGTVTLSIMTCIDELTDEYRHYDMKGKDTILRNITIDKFSTAYQNLRTTNTDKNGKEILTTDYLRNTDNTIEQLVIRFEGELWYVETQTLLNRDKLGNPTKKLLEMKDKKTGLIVFTYEYFE